MPPIIVYEDPGWQRLLPLVYMRAVFQLVCGTMDLLSRVRVHAPSEPDLWCRPNLADLVGEQTGLVVNRDAGAATLFLNGRGLWTGIPDVSDSDDSWVGTCGSDDIVCIYADSDLVTRLSAEDLLDETRLRGLLSGLPRMARRKKEMSDAESRVFMGVIRQAMAIERQPEIDEVWSEY